MGYFRKGRFKTGRSSIKGLFQRFEENECRTKVDTQKRESDI